MSEDQKSAETSNSETENSKSQNAESKKAVSRKAVRKKASSRKTAAKKSVIRKAAVQKSATKKASAKKSSAAAKTAAPASSSAAASAIRAAQDTERTLTLVRDLVETLKQENHSRDKHMAQLVSEVRQGFSEVSSRSGAQKDAQDQERQRLYDSLQHAFSNAEDSNKASEERSLMILKSLSDSLMRDHELTLKEMQEQSELQDRKIEDLTRIEEKRARRSRWLALPGMVLAIIAIIYMFQVVKVMEKAMTSMSGDMNQMNLSVGNMSSKMDGMASDTGSLKQSVADMTGLMGEMSTNTASMSRDMDRLNNNLTSMNYNLGIMTRQVSPTMKGMRDMMPWSD